MRPVEPPPPRAACTAPPSLSCNPLLTGNADPCCHESGYSCVGAVVATKFTPGSCQRTSTCAVVPGQTLADGTCCTGDPLNVGAQLRGQTPTCCVRQGRPVPPNAQGPNPCCDSAQQPLEVRNGTCQPCTRTGSVGSAADCCADAYFAPNHAADGGVSTGGGCFPCLNRGQSCSSQDQCCGHAASNGAAASSTCTTLPNTASGTFCAQCHGENQGCSADGDCCDRAQCLHTGLNGQPLDLCCAPHHRWCNGDFPNCNTDIDTDPNNCGGCGVACHAGEQCVSGHCMCLANTANDPHNCGGCGVQCDVAHPDCVRGSCVAACALGQDRCDGVNCADLTSTSNCGRCGNSCARFGSAAQCSSGNCGCPANGTVCTSGGTSVCADLRTDNNNCGVCGHQCGASRGCLNFTCGCTNVENVPCGQPSQYPCCTGFTCGADGYCHPGGGDGGTAPGDDGGGDGGTGDGGTGNAEGGFGPTPLDYCAICHPRIDVCRVPVGSTLPSQPCGSSGRCPDSSGAPCPVDGG